MIKFGAFKRFALLVGAVLLCSCSGYNDDARPQDNGMERLKKLRTGSVIPVSNTVSGYSAESSSDRLNYSSQQGIWLSYIDLAPMLTGDEYFFRAEFEKACGNISDTGFNTIYLHVRPFGDALYESKLYPASEYLTAADGTLRFDMLETACDIAHSYNLSVHAWINPLRCQTKESLSVVSSYYKTAQWLSMGNGYIKEVENSENLWLDPAYDEVRELIADGAAEIAENYDVDGIHYDDYFYPTTDEDFDAQCYAQMSGGKTLSQWRTENISEMCSNIYSAVKAADTQIEVGISPQGNIENNYDFMYADVKRWCAEAGFCDYIVPQIYFGYENSVKPFESTLRDWEDMMTSNVRLVAGLGAYKIGADDEFTRTEGIIAQQMSDAVSQGVCCGTAVYTYNSLFRPQADLSQRMAGELENIKTFLENQTV
ncbi:family 10 glycosylhydrolase [uncultured Ruminococcus sp.]|uniref:glycoside hydrolase family 10 protein n=1 Tax=uncultured Ruminococcus sp. TaxID=165186 RepID=UPI0025E715F1|nr:family 10 glycosylhydrolase [uncultured Ruminococcus sp.]